MRGTWLTKGEILGLLLVSACGFCVEPAAQHSCATLAPGDGLLEAMRGGGTREMTPHKMSGIKPPRTRREVESARGLSRPVAAAASGRWEALVGRDVEPQLGMRVRMSAASRKARPFVQNRGEGTVIAVHQSGEACMVKFDTLAGEHLYNTGQLGDYELALIEENTADESSTPAPRAGRTSGATPAQPHTLRSPAQTTPWTRRVGTEPLKRSPKSAQGTAGAPSPQHNSSSTPMSGPQTVSPYRTVAAFRASPRNGSSSGAPGSPLPLLRTPQQPARAYQDEAEAQSPSRLLEKFAGGKVAEVYRETRTALSERRGASVASSVSADLEDEGEEGQDAARAPDDASQAAGRTELERLASVLNDERAQLSKEHAALKMRVKSLLGEKSILDKQKSDVEDDKAQLQMERAAMLRERAQLDNEITKLEAVRQETEVEHSKMSRTITALEKDKRILLEQNARLSKESSAMNGQMKKLQATVLSQDDFEKRLKEFHGMVGVMEEMKKKSEENRKRLSDIEEELRQMENERDDAVHAQQEAEQAVEALKRQVREKDSELESLRQRLSEAEAEIAGLRDKLASAERARDTYASGVGYDSDRGYEGAYGGGGDEQNLRVQLVASERKLADVEGKLETLQMKLQESEKMALRRATEAAEAQRELASVRQELEDSAFEFDERADARGGAATGPSVVDKTLDSARRSTMQELLRAQQGARITPKSPNRLDSQGGQRGEPMSMQRTPSGLRGTAARGDAVRLAESSPLRRDGAPRSGPNRNVSPKTPRDFARVPNVGAKSSPMGGGKGGGDSSGVEKADRGALVDRIRTMERDILMGRLSKLEQTSYMSNRKAKELGQRIDQSSRAKEGAMDSSSRGVQSSGSGRGIQGRRQARLAREESQRSSDKLSSRSHKDALSLDALSSRVNVGDELEDLDFGDDEPQRDPYDRADIRRDVPSGRQRTADKSAKFDSKFDEWPQNLDSSMPRQEGPGRTFRKVVGSSLKVGAIGAGIVLSVFRGAFSKRSPKYVEEDELLSSVKWTEH